MSRKAIRKSTLAVTLMLLVVSAGRAFAQPDDCTTNPNIPCVVGSTIPDPQVMRGPVPDPQVVNGTQPVPQIVVGDLRLINLLPMA
jgi:hypothetical protein